MKEKYYVPKINEFHIGFEFEEEFKNPNHRKLMKALEDKYEWVKLKLDISHSLSRITSKIKENRVRVKYLDESDLIELGWEFDSVVEGDYFYIIGDMFEANYFLTTQDYRFFYIHPGAGVKKDESFVGQIKNKSEMNKLMGMLNIKNRH